MEVQTTKTPAYSKSLPDCLMIAESIREFQQELSAWVFVNMFVCACLWTDVYMCQVYCVCF